MKKTLLMAVAAAALTLAAGQSQAADYAPAAESGGWYVSIFGGISFPDDAEGQYFGSTTYAIDLDTGFLVGAAVGSTLWSDNVRGEVEISYLNNDATEFRETNGDDKADLSGDVGQWYLLANLWYDWHTDSGFTPYFGGGLGIGWVEPDIDNKDFSEDFGDFSEGTAGFAGQLGAGVKWEIADGFALDLGYRFKALIATDLENEENQDSPSSCCSLTSTDFYSHNVQLGLTVGF